MRNGDFGSRQAGIVRNHRHRHEGFRASVQARVRTSNVSGVRMPFLFWLHSTSVYFVCFSIYLFWHGYFITVVGVIRSFNEKSINFMVINFFKNLQLKK